MAGWKDCTIGELGKIVGGATPSTKDEDNYLHGKIPWITPKDLSLLDGRYISRGERNITPKGLMSCSAQLMPANSILFSSRAPIGYVAIAANELCTNQGFKSIVPNDKTDYLFLYYLLKHYKDIIEGYGNGTTFREVSGSTMRGIKVKVPVEKAEQMKIGRLLSAIDDKIEANAVINDNLQQQAQALFKAWFVDYVPWGGKKPIDWDMEALGNHVTIKRGGSPRPIQNYLADSGYRWLKISDVTSLKTPFVTQVKEHIIESGLNKTVFLNAGALVLSNSATPGIPKFLDVDSCIHDGWLYFPNSDLSNEFLYLLFLEIRPRLVSYGNGSIFINLKTDILRNYPIVFPDKATLRSFDELVHPLFISMKALTRENDELSAIRDALLPKLMSGEIDVSDVEI